MGSRYDNNIGDMLMAIINIQITPEVWQHLIVINIIVKLFGITIAKKKAFICEFIGQAKYGKKRNKD